MIKVSKSFVCRGLTDQPDSMYRTSMNISDGANLELVDMFCYLGDMLCRWWCWCSCGGF